MAALAQLVEHWIVIPGVTGSIPVCRPKQYFKKPREIGAFCFSDPIPVFFVFVRCFGRSAMRCDVNRAFCADKPHRACFVTQLDSGDGAVLAILRRAA